jgi:hypothetical protein
MADHVSRQLWFAFTRDIRRERSFTTATCQYGPFSYDEPQ